MHAIDKFSTFARKTDTRKAVVIQSHLGYGRCIVENIYKVAGQVNRFVVDYNELEELSK